MDSEVYTDTESNFENDGGMHDGRYPADIDVESEPDDQPADNSDIEPDSDGPDAGQWVRNLRGFPRIPPFTGDSGLKVELGDNPEPIDVYRLFIDDEIIRHIKTETNKYAKHCIDERRRNGPLPQNSIFAKWKPVTVQEIQNFFAVCMHMGVLKKPQIYDYWSTHGGLHSSYAPQIMSRHRFLAVLAFLHVNDNSTFVPYGHPHHDPIHKIRPFMEHLQRKFEEVYVPEQKVHIGEAMCPFRGRSRFKVYMKDKPNKWGFKFYELRESRSGYVFRLEMFCADKRCSNKPYDVVMRLMDPLLHKGYQLFIDSYYCSEPLCNQLASKGGTMVCGKAHVDGKTLPKEDFVKVLLARGQLDYRRKDRVVLCKWRDKKDVWTLSTMHKPELQRTQGHFELKEKPKAVIGYIENTAVDNSYRLTSYFPMHPTTLKWWKKPFFHLLTLTTIQTLIILNKHRASKGRKRLSLEEVVKSLLLALPADKCITAPQNAGSGQRLSSDRLEGGPKCHFPKFIPATMKEEKPRRNCKLCYEKMKREGESAANRRNKRPRTHYWCPKCDVALCLDPCFEVYHTEKNYLAE